MEENQRIYDSADVTRNYASQTNLQPPEEAILRELLPRLPKWRMLDIGVGGGRTALHFAKWAREYVGTDYSENMILECRRRFAGYPSHISFQVCDARDMNMFEAKSFEFILFSFNGIDSVGREDRLKILKEIRRIGAPGAPFCFSSHNLNWNAKAMNPWRLANLNPRFAARTAKRLVLRFWFNRGLSGETIRSAPYVLLNDRVHSLQMITYYARPQAQVAELSQDFKNVRALSLSSGGELKTQQELESCDDPWVYYTCEIP